MDKIFFSNNQKIKLDFDIESDFSKLIDTTFKLIKKKQKSSVSVSLVSEKEIKKINKLYRNINRPTDVISFSFIENNNDKFILGEMYICIKKAIEQAKEFDHSIRREVCFLFVHGLLHILGYNHNDKKEEKIMFNLQDKILNKLEITR